MTPQHHTGSAIPHFPENPPPPAHVMLRHKGAPICFPQANTPQVFDDAVFNTDLDGGLDAEPPTLETPADTPPVGMAACNSRVRKPPEIYSKHARKQV